MPDETPVSPTGAPTLPQWAVKYAVLVVGVAAGLSLLPDMGIALHPLVVQVDKVVLALGVIFGITSQGVRR